MKTFLPTHILAIPVTSCGTRFKTIEAFSGSKAGMGSCG